ncbi:hypothetical protein M3936_12090 [Sutcliffiella horikoshii]|uniref:hypothetical protein n=1 Tax=Sutcliffiella horikoshii TaxID=79883 RepID=UPI0007D07570|nr:hypothetical protein [Sutcliffiella horikoshii]MCM3618320.1 hypothetical protein [Sutcliffiella horikoshii]
MDLLLWVAIAFFVIGFSVLSYLKRNLQGSKEHTQRGLWFIIGAFTWGIVCISLVVWWFNTAF